MKQVLFLLTIVMLFSFCACGTQQAQSTPEPEQEPVQTSEAALEEKEPVTELLMEEFYQGGVTVEDRRYSLYIYFYPQISQCRITSYQGRTGVTLYSGSYTEADGLYTIDNGGQIIQFRRGEESLTIEKGSLTAYCGMVYNETEEKYEDFEGIDSIQMESGTELDAYPQFTYLYDGIYILDDSEYDYDFDEVLLDIDLTEMTFALKGYDGSVVTGKLEMEFSYGLCNVICRYEGGAMAFDVYQTWVYDENQNGTIATVLYDSSYNVDTIITNALMYYPSDSLSQHFYYAPERTDQIVVDPDVVPLDSFKEVVYERYHFQMSVPEDPEYACGMSIIHCPLTGSWQISSKTGIQAEGTENPDGTITLSAEGNIWNFHREDNGLTFDGGSPLIAKNSETMGPQFEVELEPGTWFWPGEFNYLYDTIYIVPDKDGGYSAAMRIDQENQRIIVANNSGYSYEGPFTFADYWLDCYFGITGAQVFFDGHVLESCKYSVLNPAANLQESQFIPAHTTPELLELLKFIVPALPLEEAPAGSILVFEQFDLLTRDDKKFCMSTLILNPQEGRYYFNDDYFSFCAEGIYTEENGTITLDQSEMGYGTTQLRREDTSVVIEGGEPLYLSGMPLTEVQDLLEELDPGTHLPRCDSGWLYNGTYTFTSDQGEASVTFDTKNRTFTLTDAKGTTYDGSFTLENKFVYCDAGSRTFQFIPYGDQVRLNQSEGETVVPVEDNFIYFDFSE